MIPLRRLKLPLSAEVMQRQHVRSRLKSAGTKPCKVHLHPECVQPTLALNCEANLMRWPGCGTSKV